MISSVSNPSNHGDSMTFSSEEEIKLRISEHQAQAGRVGGRSRSPEKKIAVSNNLKKARAKRWPGREAAAIEREAMATMLLEVINVPSSETPLAAGSRGSREEPKRGGCGISLHQPDSSSDQQGDGGSNGSSNERASGELFGFVFERGVPKGRRTG
jgi:hypothetical protein